MLGRPPSRKARDREIRRAPEVVHGTALSDEARTEHLEHAVGLYERAPVAMRVLAVVRAVDVVLVERDRIRNLVRPPEDVDVHVELRELSHETAVERGDRLRRERDPPDSAIGRLDRELVRDE